jgi:2-oxoglutarate dehydrogenase E2 component (dihydrolipoamide succinyltransferase)
VVEDISRRRAPALIRRDRESDMSINIVVPEVGESIVDARVARWLKQPGEAVAAGEPLVELETDKVDVEVAAPRAGVLEAIAHADGQDVKIGDVLGTIREGEAPAAAPPAPPTPPALVAPTAQTASLGVFATPSARRAAREKDVNLAAVKPRGARVTRSDVDRAVPRPGPRAVPVPPHPAPAPGTSGDRPVTRERLSKRRATIARRLVEAQQTAAMLTTFNEVDMTAVMALRARHKEAFKAKYGFGLGIASFFVRAAVAALKEFPRLNAEIQGDEMVLKHYYDIGMAVGAEGGLVVPVIRDADQASFAEIEGLIRILATKAADGTLTIEDLRGGTFSITNGGVYGSLMSTPILNPPQVGILGLHAIKERPVGVDGAVVLRPMMYTALTYDHRIVDGSDAVRFLVRIKDLVEDPGVLLIES